MALTIIVIKKKENKNPQKCTNIKAVSKSSEKTEEKIEAKTVNRVNL